MKRRIVDALDASRMTAQTSIETANRVGKYFGDMAPFSYQKVRRLAPILLAGALPYRLAVAGIEKTSFELARKCNLDVAKLVADCTEFRGKPFYPLTRVLYPIDQNFAVSVRPETVAVVDGVPNLIFCNHGKMQHRGPTMLGF